MFIRLSDKLTEFLINSKAIEEKDQEIYHYGIQQGMILLMNFFTTIFIGILCGMFWQSIIFTSVYVPLRSYAGGFHAKTSVRCYAYSIVMMFAVLLAMRFLPLGNLIC